VLGKEGESGGFSRLHYEIFATQASGLGGTHDPYAFIWAPYQYPFKPNLIAVALPHKFAHPGEPVTLDGSKSWSASGKIARFGWMLSNGTKRKGVSYASPGQRSGGSVRQPNKP